MGKKKDKANKNIEKLINELVSYQEAYVGSANCPYTFHLLGADDIEKPKSCHLIGCESCKENFYIKINENLQEKYIVL